MKAEMISTDEFYVGNSEYAILVPIGCASGLIADLIAIEAINDADFVQVMSDKAAFALLDNTSYRIEEARNEGCMKEYERTQADIDKETAEDERRAKYNDCY